MTTIEPRYFLVLPAAGAGHRMQSVIPKQYQSLLGKPLLQHTLERVANNPIFSQVVVALSAGDEYWPAVEAALPAALCERLVTVQGGAERAASVEAALASLVGNARANDWVLVHDAVRPCLATADLHRLMSELHNEVFGGLLATPVRETIKAASADGTVSKTVPRDGLWLAATPQMFRFEVLADALKAARVAGAEVTDEASAVELWLLTQQQANGIKLVQGRATNIKVTYPEDLRLAAVLLGENDEH